MGGVHNIQVEIFTRKAAAPDSTTPQLEKHVIGPESNCRQRTAQKTYNIRKRTETERQRREN
jgi:hypothetical protein